MTVPIGHGSDEFPLSAYRDRTLSMLRRYNRAAIETGRLPSLLGREFFRARVSSYTVHTFEDAIIFVFDMERCLDELTRTERTVIARTVLQDYTQLETARLMHCDERTIRRVFHDAVDHLTEIMLDHGLLNASILAPRRLRRYTVAPEPGVSTLDPTQTDALPQPIPAIGVVSLQACQEAKNNGFAASA